MSVENIVGQKIKMLCNDNSITWEELSERTGLSKEQIDLIVNSSTIPTLASLIKIARALGVRLGTFLDDYEETPQSRNKRIGHLLQSAIVGQFTSRLCVARSQQGG